MAHSPTFGVSRDSVSASSETHGNCFAANGAAEQGMQRLHWGGGYIGDGGYIGERLERNAREQSSCFPTVVAAVTSETAVTLGEWCTGTASQQTALRGTGFCHVRLRPIRRLHQGCRLHRETGGNCFAGDGSAEQGIRLRRIRRLHRIWRLHREGRARLVVCDCGARGPDPNAQPSHLSSSGAAAQGILMRTPSLLISAQVALRSKGSLFEPPAF